MNTLNPRAVEKYIQHGEVRDVHHILDSKITQSIWKGADNSKDNHNTLDEESRVREECFRPRVLTDFGQH